MNNKINKKGFTLVELMLVLIIISIILIATIPNILEAINENRKESGKSVEKVLLRNLELYNKDHEEDLWLIEKDKANCTNVDISELLNTNPDIKLGECLLNNGNNSLIIRKKGKDKYEYQAGITCGKGLTAKSDNQYLLNSDSNADIYYSTTVVSCDGFFTLRASLNSGTVVDNKEIWTVSGDSATLNAESGKQITLPTIEKEGYVFKGWNSDTDGNGMWINDGNEATPEIDSIYAIWEKETDGRELTFDGQTIEVYYNENLQRRTITAFTGGVEPYTYVEKSEKNASGTNTNYMSINGSNILIAGSTPIGEYKYEVEATDNAGNKKSGVITIKVVQDSSSVRCPTLTAYNAVYDRNSHTIGVRNDAVGGTVEYSVSASGPWSTTKPTRTDAGTTTVYVRVVGRDSYYASKDCGSRAITITPKIVQIPTTSASCQSNLIYSGAEQTLTKAAGEGYNYLNNKKTNAGTYTVTAKLTNTNNYKWNDNTITDKTFSCSISTKNVTVIWGSTTTFTYNGNPQAPTVSVSTGIPGESMTVTRTTGTNAGDYTSTASCSSVTGGQANCSNYNLIEKTKPFKITPKVLTATVTASNKIYDRSTSATCSSAVSLSGVVSGDTVTATANTSGTFDNKNVGTGKTVTCSGITLAGASKGNYTVAGTKTTTASITAKALTPTASCSNKTYDGNTTATCTKSFSGVISGDTVTASATSCTFDNKNVGTGKTVTCYGYSKSGADNGNYSLSSTSATTTASITAKALTPTASCSNKTYDGNTTATCTKSFSGVISGDTVTASATSCTFNNKNVGTTKTVTCSGYSKSGADNGNYSLSSTSTTTTANITKKSIAVSWTNLGPFTYKIQNAAGGGKESVEQAPTPSVSTGITGETMVLSWTKYKLSGSHTSTASCSSVTGGACTNYTLTNYTKAYVINCQKLPSGTYTVGRTVSYGETGSNWTIASTGSNSNGSYVGLAYNNITAVKGGYSSDTTNLASFLNNYLILKDAADNGCIVKQTTYKGGAFISSNSGINTNLEGQNYWVNTASDSSASINNANDRTRYSISNKSYVYNYNTGRDSTLAVQSLTNGSYTTVGTTSKGILSAAGNTYYTVNKTAGTVTFNRTGVSSTDSASYYSLDALKHMFYNSYSASTSAPVHAACNTTRLLNSGKHHMCYIRDDYKVSDAGSLTLQTRQASYWIENGSKNTYYLCGDSSHQAKTVSVEASTDTSKIKYTNLSGTAQEFSNVADSKPWKLWAAGAGYAACVNGQSNSAVCTKNYTYNGTEGSFDFWNRTYRMDNADACKKRPQYSYTNNNPIDLSYRPYIIVYVG